VLDANGDLYVANAGARSSIAVYSPTSTRPLRTIVTGIHAPSALAFDASGKLFVANNFEDGSFAVTVFEPGSSTPAYTIHGNASTRQSPGDEPAYPAHLALDSSGHLYVAKEGSIQIYGRANINP
jgi:DNA-binding beta-propeller fold protein YncE